MVHLGMLGVGESAEVVGFRRDHGHGAGMRVAIGVGCHGHNCSGDGAGKGHAFGRERRLAELGFSAGQRVEVIQNSAGIPLLLKVCDSRIAIDSTIAMNIMVRRRAS